MKSSDLIVFEIESKIQHLKSKGVTPRVIVLGDLSYNCLANKFKEQCVKSPNEVLTLKKFKDLDVIVNEEWSKPGVYKEQNEYVKVYGD